MRIATLLFLLLVAGCASHHRLAQCDGPLEALNTDRWQPTKQELTALGRSFP